MLNSFHFSFKTVLRDITSSKEKVINFLQTHHVFATSMICPGPIYKGKRMHNCNKPMTLKKTTDRTDGLVWRCRKVHEVVDGDKKYIVKDVKVSIRENSWLLDAKLKLEDVVEFIYLWSQGFNTDDIHHELGLSRKTIIEWSAYLREVCFQTVMDETCQIGGKGIEVEIDESKFGRRKYYRGHRVEGQWVFGGREKKDKTKIFMVPVGDRKQITLLPIIKKWIKEGSIIHSDCWKAYSCLQEHGYKHVTVNHSKEFRNWQNGACTNAIECDWRHAKVSMPSYGVHKGLHAGYLAEFMWKRKYMYEDKFLCLIKNINETYRKSNLEQLPKS